MADQIESVAVVTVRAPLPVTISFGPWVMKHREFILCRIRTTEGNEGFGFVYTRDAPIAAVVRLSATVLHPDDNVRRALDVFGASRADTLVVTARGSEQVLGTLGEAGEAFAQDVTVAVKRRKTMAGFTTPL